MSLVRPPAKRRREMPAIDEEKVRLLLGQAKRSPYYRLYLAAVMTGMRQGELLGLRWQDVDFTFGTASVQQTFYRLGGQQFFKAPKTAKSRRTVGLPGVLAQELQGLREEQASIAGCSETPMRITTWSSAKRTGDRCTRTTSSSETSGRLRRRLVSGASGSTTSGMPTRPCSSSRACILRSYRSASGTPASQ